ncbi:MAG: glycoside hydrolase family 99-like domain-containing protein [Bacteroidales bacterium]|jgi:hypothetical protein|nr:glycoside hydrolase family 99-like domain-containing protein [Bacteroidales bacterium]
MNQETKHRKARVIAFYLPQFHPIPENDKHWGKGFTEWTNVAKAKPLFRGHYQPRIPADLGFYDLRLPEVREAQAAMARECGIEGFMYWHYWFGNGKTALERPFAEVLESGKPDFPFSLAWANHSWTTRTWEKKKGIASANTMIFEQQYSTDDYIKHFYHLLPAFKDSRYITVNGEPVFLVFSPHDLPNPQEFITLWKQLAVQNGLKGIHFVGLTSGWLNTYQKILDDGFDAIAPGSQWHAETKAKGKIIKMLQHKIRPLLPYIPLDKYRYKDIIKHIFTDFDRQNNGYPSVIPQWDRSPRAGRQATVYTGSTPALFKKHLANAVETVKNKPDQQKIILLRAWNEWAEGNYVEPDQKYGRQYLDAIREVLLENNAH